MARGFWGWFLDILKIFTLVGELQAVLIVTPHASSSRSLKCSKKWFPYGDRTSLLPSLQELLPTQTCTVEPAYNDIGL